MSEIIVKANRTESGWQCSVVVKENESKTTHSVSIKKEDYEKLTNNKVSVEVLVEKSFEFLLEREPKESILESFDLMLISRYFPEYEEIIKCL